MAGAGFLIGEDVVVTCAHVVRADGHGPGERVRLVFPRAEGAPRAEGQVLVGPWRAPDADDVAIIRLSDVPATVEPLPVGKAAGCRGHRVRSFGFPAQAPPGGHFGYGTAGDLLPPTDVDGGGGLLQLTGANDLTQGFSGGPVVDEVTGLVIGMVTAITAPDGHLRGQGIAYATPTEILREVWPDLVEREVRPYRGLEPFTAEHTAWFHGRDTAVDAVVSALADNRRALLLLGPSGSGKSSLMQAGVLPALESGRLPGSDRWLPVLVPRPGRDLLTELERHGLPGARTDGIASALQHRLAADPGYERIVLVIDQFEEVFTQPAAPPAPVVEPRTGEAPSRTPAEVLEEVTAVIGSRAAVSVILIMRDDFYPQLAASGPELLDAAAPGLVNVPATLSPQDLHAIITRPARAAGVRFEEGLPERIITDVLAADHHGTSTRRAPVTLLAPLELALGLLWERRTDGHLTHAAYERVGQITGSLANWCNSAIDKLPDSHRDTARRILTALVHPPDPGRHIPATRQQVPLDVLRELAADTPQTPSQPPDEITDAVLATLTRHRIITTYARVPGPPPTDMVAELTHDTLTRDWAELRDWVDQDRRFHTWLRRAEEQQARWTQGDTPGDLLHGTDLAEGLDWARQRRLPGTIAAFVAASDRNERAAIRRTRRINVFLAGALTLALIAAGLAFWQRQSALTQRQAAITAQHQALSRQLASQSDALFDTNPDLASLLAVQAYRTSPTAEATASLYAAARLPLQHRLTGHTGPVRSVAFSPDGHTLASGSYDGTVGLWDPATGRARATLTGDTGIAWSVAFSPDGHTLASGGDDGTVRLWDPATGRARATLTGHTGTAWSVAFSPDGHTLATGSDDGTVRLWDPATGRARATLKGHTDVVRSVAFSPDGHTLASGSYDGTVRLWDPAAGRARATLKGPTGYVWSVAFSPDGHTLASGSDDHTVRLWDPATGRTRTTLNDLVVSVAFSPDGHTLASGSDDHTVRLWDPATGRTRTTLTGHTGTAWSVAFSPDGHTLASGSVDRTVRLWDPATGRTRTTLTSPVVSVAFSPDGHTLATGGYYGTLRLWDPLVGRARATLTGHTGTVWSVAFSPDGHTLATGGDDGTVRLWDVELPDQTAAIRKICQAVGRDLTREERATYVGDQSPGAVCPS
ncbi:trypsin-like peptidase domain-containing protein [Streptomyces sp. NPDC086549]|uniref:nSTAND1 domain-containing NTPase n=1 Tax=Streptomyces sp. NPDC086549 TaxID=3365752 RepID=UPI003801BDE1